MPSDEVTSPYVGLRPFGEKERAFFFGRERDISIIATNVVEEPLTVIYGPSGAGKSSVLQAGVLPHLKSLANAAVVYFRNWQSDTFQEDLRANVLSVLGRAELDGLSPNGGSLQDLVINAKQHLFLLLDQFEEYLLYHSDARDDGFDTTIARIVNRSDVQARVLIGLREDGLSRLNERFAIRIPDLLGNTLQVERLSLSAARNAIQKPLEVFTRTAQAEGKVFSIEESLVEEILEQVQEGRGIASESAGKGTRNRDADVQIETAYLQLVLTKLWEAERKLGSTALRLKTFHELGGASEIVRNHVRSVMDTLGSDHLRDIAARLFLYLVTPSRTKIAQRTEDLVTFGEAPEAEVRQVLNTLAEQQETRILRRLSNPEQYEIFHDVLAQHILDWRRSYEEQKRLAEQERRQKEEADRKQRELEQAQRLAAEQQLRADEQARAARKLRRMVAALILVVIAAVAAATYGLVEQSRANASAAVAIEEKKRADASAELAKESEARAQETLFQLKAAQARQANDQAAAQQYQQMAEDNRRKAEEAAKQAEQQGSTALSTAQQLKHTTDELAQVKQERDKLASQVQDRDNLASQVKVLQQQIDEMKKRSVTTEPRQGKGSQQTVPP
jgi:hypothetical protein